MNEMLKKEGKRLLF